MLNIIENYLLKKLIVIAKNLRLQSFKNHKRVNPLLEDLIDWKERGEFLFGKKNITVYGSSTIVGDVKVGKNSWIGPYTALDGAGGLEVGENCSISSGVNIVSHDSIKWALSGGLEDYEYAPIFIGNNCFIGTKAFIGKGVKIGNNCLIAAGAVVTKSFGDNSIIGGIPAKRIGIVEILANGYVKLIYKTSI